MTIKEYLRLKELDGIRHLFRSGHDVLDMGEGNRFQASLIAGIGCSIRSIDVEPPPREQQYFFVEKYDGHSIPFANASFDCVFSSNVLEHIAHLPVILAEIHRVLRPNGLAVHVLPSISWRFYTSVAHYPQLVLRLLRMRSPDCVSK